MPFWGGAGQISEPAFIFGDFIVALLVFGRFAALGVLRVPAIAQPALVVAYRSQLVICLVFIFVIFIAFWSRRALAS